MKVTKKEMTSEQMSGFFDNAERLLTDAREALADIREDYPMIIIMQAISLSSGIEVDCYVEAAGLEENGLDGIMQLRGIADIISEEIKEIDGCVKVGGKVGDVYTMSIKFAIVG